VLAHGYAFAVCEDGYCIGLAGVLVVKWIALSWLAALGFALVCVEFVCAGGDGGREGNPSAPRRHLSSLLPYLSNYNMYAVIMR